MKAIFGLVLTIPCFLWAPPAQAEDILILASKVYTMTGPPLSPGAVLVSKGKIVEVGMRKLDRTGGAPRSSTLEPACSCRAWWTLTARRASPAARPNPPAKSLPLFASSIASTGRPAHFVKLLKKARPAWGSPPARTMSSPGFPAAVKTTGDRRVVEPQLGVLIAMASDPANGNNARGRPDSIYNRQPTNRMGVVWMLRATFDKAGRTKTPELASVTDGLQGKRKIFSVSRTDYDLLSLLRLAKEFNFTPTVIGGHEAYKVRPELVAAKVPVILGSLTTSSSLEGPEGSEVIWNQPGLLQKAGIPFALSGGHLLEQARFATRFGLAPEDALRAITSTPAKLLGIDKRLGTLSVGSDADMVAFDGDPLELTTSIRWLLVDGKIYDKGE